MNRTTRLHPSVLRRDTGLTRKTPLRAVSNRRAAENRQRQKMIARLYPERPRCARPGCTRMADDVHEPRFRSRLGSIVDPENQVALCRECHDWVHTHEQEAQELGLAVHSWE